MFVDEGEFLDDRKEGVMQDGEEERKDCGLPNCCCQDSSANTVKAFFPSSFCLNVDILELNV